MRSSERRSRRLLIVLTLGAFALGLGPCLGVVGWALWRAARAQGLKGDSLIEARRVGLPTQWSDLREGPPVAPEADAAPLYRRFERRVAGADAPTQAAFVSARRLLDGRDTPEDRQRVAELPFRFVSGLAILDRASQRAGCGLPFDRPVWKARPPSQTRERMKTGVVVLGALAVLDAQAGKAERAESRLMEAIRVTHHLGDTPEPLPLYAQVAGEETVFKALSRMLESRTVDAGLMRRSYIALGEVPDLPQALRGEFLFDVDLARRLQSQPDGVARLIVGYFSDRLVETWVEHYPELPKNPKDVLGLRRALAAFESDLRGSFLLEGMALAVSPNLPTSVGEALERRELLRLAADRLDGRTETRGTDALTGDPLRERRLPGETLLWGVARNLKDDGGRPYRGGPHANPNWDIVLRVPLAR